MEVEVIDIVIEEIAVEGLKHGLIIGLVTMLVSKGLSITWKLLANRDI